MAWLSATQHGTAQHSTVPTWPLPLRTCLHSIVGQTLKRTGHPRSSQAYAQARPPTVLQLLPAQQRLQLAQPQMGARRTALC